MKEISDLVIVMGTTVSESEKEGRNRKAGLHFRHSWWLGEFLLICFFCFFSFPLCYSMFCESFPIVPWEAIRPASYLLLFPTASR